MNKMYCIIDNHVDNGFIAFCSTPEKAREMCHEYCADVYDDAPEDVKALDGACDWYILDSIEPFDIIMVA